MWPCPLAYMWACCSDTAGPVELVSWSCGQRHDVTRHLFRPASICAAAAPSEDHSSSNQSSAAALSPHDWLRSVPLRVSSSQSRRRRALLGAVVELGCAYLAAAELQHQSVGHELDVLLHELTVHPNQIHRQSLGQELLHPDQRDQSDQRETPGRPITRDQRETNSSSLCVTHLLDLHGVLDDVTDSLCRRLVHQVFEHQTGKVTVQTLNTTQS